MMEQLLAILILVPTVMVLTIGVLYIVGTIAMSGIAGIDAIVTTIRHRLRPSGRPHANHYGAAALHH